MLYREYEHDVLKKLQETELDMLKDFAELCEKHNIDYFGCGGTCIGAVRHGGFIPWDDDIDIAFTRAEFDRFVEVAKKEFAGKYTVLNADNDPNYVLMSTRLVKVGTKFQEECFKNSKCDFGIFLDLYCFDNVPDDEKLMKKQAFWAWFWSKLLIMCEVSHPTLYVTGIKKTIISTVSFLGHYFLKLVPNAKKFFYKKAKANATKYRNQKTKRIAYLFDPQLYTSMISLDDVIPTKKLPYSGLNVRFPGKIESYLTKRYGPDYMTPPPEEKRHNHPPYILSFGDERE